MGRAGRTFHLVVARTTVRHLKDVGAPRFGPCKLDEHAHFRTDLAKPAFLRG